MGQHSVLTVVLTREGGEPNTLCPPCNSPPLAIPPPAHMGTVTLIFLWQGVVVLRSIVLCVLVPTITVDSFSRTDTNVCRRRLCLVPLSQ